MEDRRGRDVCIGSESSPGFSSVPSSWFRGQQVAAARSRVGDRLIAETIRGVLSILGFFLN